MKLVATARNRSTGYVHTLRDQKLTEKQISVSGDAEVTLSVPIRTNGLSGEYNLVVTISREEAMLVAERAYTARLESQIIDLRQKLVEATKSKT